MKEQIISKLFNGKELDSNELIYIGKNLIEDKKDILLYDHNNKSSLEACGLCEDDVTSANKQFRELCEQDLNMSRMVEAVEGMVYSSQKILRMIIFQSIRAGMEREMEKSHGMPDKFLSDLLKKFLKKGKDNEENMD